jgi:hypothetical protein
VLLDLLLFIVYQLTINQVNIIFKLIIPGVYLLLNVIGSVGVFVILQNIAVKINTSKLIWRFGSKHSMTIYLFHQQLIYIILTVGNGHINSCDFYFTGSAISSYKNIHNITIFSPILEIV